MDQRLETIAMWGSSEDPVEFTPDPEAMLDEAIEEAGRWIKEVTYRDLVDPKDLQKSLANGVLLCELLLAIKRDSVKRPNRYTTKENLKEFRRASEQELGLDPSSQIFSADDLQSTSKRLSWAPPSATTIKSDREKLKSIITTIYWIADAASKISSFSGPKLDVYSFESVIFGIYSPREEDPNPQPDVPDHSSHDSGLNSGPNNGDGTDSTAEDELNFFSIPTNIEYKEPKWKAALKALQVEDQEPPLKPIRGLPTESAPDINYNNKENFEYVRVAVVEDSASAGSTADSQRTPASDDTSNVVLRQPSAVRLRKMERKLGRKAAPPTAAKPHTRSLSLPESTNVTLMRQNALDSNHNSATYEDITDEDSDMWRSSFTSWKMKRNQVASNVLERKAFREEVDELEHSKGKKKPKTFKEIVEEKQRRENLLAKKFQRKKDLEKDEIQAILTSVDLVDSDDDDDDDNSDDDQQEQELEPEIQMERRSQQHAQLETVTEPYPRASTLPTRGSKASPSTPHKPAAITATSATLPPPSQKAVPSVAPKPKYRPSAGAFQPYRRSQSLKEADYPDSSEGTATHTSSPSPTATTPSEEAFPARSFHEKMVRERQKGVERAEVAKTSQAKARQPTQKRLSMGILGRVAAFNSGEAFKKGREECDEERDPVRISTALPTNQTRPAMSTALENRGGFTEHTITMNRRPRAQGGFGFTVTGGIDKKKPIIVKGIDPGSTAGSSDLQIGDEIILINNEKTKTFDHDDIQYSISQAVLSGKLTLKIRRYDDPSQSQLRPRSVSSSSSSSISDAQIRAEMERERWEAERRQEEAERMRREEERRREEKRKEEERRKDEKRREEERRRDEERRREEEEERLRGRQPMEDESSGGERRWREEQQQRRLQEAEWRRRVEEERRRQEEDSEGVEEEEDEYAPKASSSNALSRAKQLLTELGDDESSPEENPRQSVDQVYTNGDSWRQLEKRAGRNDDVNTQEEERLEEEIIARMQEEQKREEEREEVHRQIEEDEQDKSPVKELITTSEQKVQESVPSLSSLSLSGPSVPVVKPIGFRSVKGPRPYFSTNKGPEPFKPQPTTMASNKDDDIKERVKKDRSEFFSDDDVSPQSNQNVEDLWRRVEQPTVETTRAEDREGLSGVQRRMKPKNEVDPSNRKSFNLDQERQRLEKWQKEQERIRQEQYEQEQRRIREESEKELQRAENQSKRKQEMELQALKERKRMLQKKAQEEIRKREEEALERERKERERRRLEQLEREEEERRRRHEEELLQQEREERERLEQEQRERQEARRRQEEEQLIVQRRKEEERRAQELEKQRAREEREAREKKAREKIEREKEEYERLLKEREEEKERLAREQERQRAAKEREEKQRAIRVEEERQHRAREEERQRIARDREARLRALREQEEREQLAREQEGRAHSKKPIASEFIRPQMHQHQESAPVSSFHQQQQQRYSRQHQSEEDLYERIREEERERIRREERDRLRREWDQLEKEKREQQERQRREEEKLERLRKEQELQRAREKVEQQRKVDMERQAKQRGIYSKSISDDVFDDVEKVAMKNTYNRQKQVSHDDLRKPSPTEVHGRDIIDKKMIPERDTKPGQVFMARHKGDALPTEQHWLVEEARRRQQGLLSKSSENLPIQPRKDSLDHEPVLEKKNCADVHAAPPAAHPYGKPYKIDHRKNGPPGYEPEVPTRIPPPNRDQGSLTRTKQQQQHSFPHEQQPSSSSDTNRWDAPRHKYDAQPEFRHVQQRMHGGHSINDPGQKQKMHDRQSMPDLNVNQSYAAPVARIMDDPSRHRGPGGGAPLPIRGGAPPSSPHHHSGPGGDQRRAGPAPDNLIQHHDQPRGPKSPNRGNRGPPSPHSHGSPRQQQPQPPLPPHHHHQKPPQQQHHPAPGRGPRSSAFQQPSKNPPPGRSVSGKVQCSNCGKSLGRGAAMIIESLGLHFHLECFRCCVCNIQLGNGTKGTDVRIRACKLHCQKCYSNDAGYEFTEV